MNSNSLFLTVIMASGSMALLGFGVIMVTGVGWIIYNNTKTEKTRKRKHKK